MSGIKRDRGVKDYGTLVSGHAGVLDRIDSICFAAPVFFHIMRYFFAEALPGQVCEASSYDATGANRPSTSRTVRRYITRFTLGRSVRSSYGVSSPQVCSQNCLGQFHVRHHCHGRTPIQSRRRPGNPDRPPRDAKEGDKITFDRVLLVSDGGSVKVGQPTVAGASVTAEVLGAGNGRQGLYPEDSPPQELSPPHRPPADVHARADRFDRVVINPNLTRTRNHNPLPNLARAHAPSRGSGEANTGGGVRERAGLRLGRRLGLGVRAGLGSP